MNKLVIHTQYLENYGDSKDPYMKFKGGTTYVMSNCGELNENEIATLVARVKPYITTDLVKSNGGSEEYINDVKVVPHMEQVCADWDSVTEFSFDLFGHVNFIKITDNREDGWMRKEILETTETWTNDRKNYKKEFLMDNGDFCIGNKEAGTWLKEHAVVESKIERNITF
jgi:hypothetical protein